VPGVSRLRERGGIVHLFPSPQRQAVENLVENILRSQRNITLDSP
jgi:hypothetical protein